jgi:phosphoribosyl 1,2-cyclic phosphodiesterase
VVVEAEGERLILDAGIGPTRAAERMRSLGADLVTARAPLGVFITHDHGDHSAHALPLARALRAPLFAHDRATLERPRKRLDVRSFSPSGRAATLGPFVVEAMPVPHDAPHVALRISAGSRRVALATDVGHPTRELCAFLAASDLVLLEANYCPRMLDEGPYPPRLRARVAGPLGHLANEQAAEVARALEDTRVSRLVLVHLSRANNTPARALDVVGASVRRLAVDALTHGASYLFDVASNASPAYAEQLAFGF